MGASVGAEPSVHHNLVDCYSQWHRPYDFRMSVSVFSHQLEIKTFLQKEDNESIS
jgi:hypothetical protein